MTSDLEQYAWRQAHLMITPASDRDDAVQEAMLAVWRAGDRSTSYLQGVIYKRIADFAATRRHTGSEQPVGSKAVDVLRKRIWFDPRSTNLPDEVVDDLYGWHQDTTDDPLQRDRVRAAIRRLPKHHRMNVFRRFWMDDPGSRAEQAQWRLTIRPALRKSLTA